tara:strand:+ start:1217 stop:3064 length:1848 start_codon:yes stop_codon:yes gene_type:complete
MKLLLSLGGAVFLGMSLSAVPFEPDDPYYNPYYYDGGSELYAGQWHLDNQAPISVNNAGLDVNVLEAWGNGWTGAGVIIGIIDDGVEGSHSDLVDNFWNAYSWGFGKDQATNLGESYRGFPVVDGLGGNGDNHGTAVAGVAAARGDNGVGMTGAAPYAGIASLRFLSETYSGGISEEEAEAAAILYQGQTDLSGNPNPFVAPTWDSVPVRVKNHSYGPNVGFVLDEDSQLVLEAFEESASHGVLHVISAGNQRIEDGWDPWSTGDTNKILNSVLPENIIVAALGSDGVFSGYSSYGASVFVTAPSNGVDGFGIATTDREGESLGDNKNPSAPDPALDFSDGYNYTSDFGGTSSAAPLVSGIMALGVEANPNMDYRMAKHIMVRTNRVVDAGDSSSTGRWIVNGGGNSFNNNYGFGLIDAGAFTEMASQSIEVTEETEYESGEIEVNQSFADEGDNEITETFEVSVDSSIDQPIEMILVEMTIIGLETDWATYSGGTGSIMGDFSAWLTSPFGTRNELFTNDRGIPDVLWEDRRDYHNDELEWQFLSNAYWGEDVNGLWTLELYNDTGNPLTGTWEDFSFTATMGDLLLVPEPSSYGLLFAIGILPVLIRRRRREG